MIRKRTVYYAKKVLGILTKVLRYEKNYVAEFNIFYLTILFNMIKIIIYYKYNRNIFLLFPLNFANFRQKMKS